MTSSTAFKSDWVTPPGTTVMDLMRARGLRESEFASELGCSKDYLTLVLQGAAPITADLADGFEGVFGTPSAFWIRREADYQARRTEALISEGEQWVRTLPTKEMLRWGWVAQADGWEQLAESCLSFFGVATPAQWKAEHLHAGPRAAFRTSQTYAGDVAATAAWLRRGELRAAAIECGALDRGAFADSLPELRQLTRQRDPKKFLPALVASCSRHGVAVVVERAPKGCRASGAVRELDNRILLMLSARYLTDDHFWFAFFHEAAHVVLHPGKRAILEWEEKSSDAELEADRYAMETLIPRANAAEFRRLPCQYRAVQRFAFKIGISPGIVVGQMQHRGMIGYQSLNRLKVRYKWSSS